MRLEDYIKDGRLEVIVKPNAKKTQITGFDEPRGALRIDVKAPPEDNKANIELARFLSKESGKRAVISKGQTSKKKSIRFV